MATIQDAVKLLTLFLTASTLLVSTAYAEEPVDHSEIQIYYDSTQPAYYLLDYKLRLLVLLNDGRESCWEPVNGRWELICKPLENASVKIVYQELKEFREATTNDEGVAEVSFRLYTYPRATFRVEVYSPEGYAETTVKVEPKIWMLLTIASFSSMLSILVLVVRRGLW